VTSFARGGCPFLELTALSVVCSPPPCPPSVHPFSRRFSRGRSRAWFRLIDPCFFFPLDPARDAWRLNRPRGFVFGRRVDLAESQSLLFLPLMGRGRFVLVLRPTSQVPAFPPPSHVRAAPVASPPDGPLPTLWPRNHTPRGSTHRFLDFKVLRLVLAVAFIAGSSTLTHHPFRRSLHPSCFFFRVLLDGISAACVQILPASVDSPS